MTLNFDLDLSKGHIVEIRLYDCMWQSWPRAPNNEMAGMVRGKELWRRKYEQHAAFYMKLKMEVGGKD